MDQNLENINLYTELLWTYLLEPYKDPTNKN